MVFICKDQYVWIVFVCPGQSSLFFRFSPLLLEYFWYTNEPLSVLFLFLVYGMLGFGSLVYSLIVIIENKT